MKFVEFESGLNVCVVVKVKCLLFYCFLVSKNDVVINQVTCFLSLFAEVELTIVYICAEKL